MEVWAEGSRKDVSENMEVWHTRSRCGESSVKRSPKGGLSGVSLGAEQLGLDEKHEGVAVKLWLGSGQ